MFWFFIFGAALTIVVAIEGERIQRRRWKKTEEELQKHLGRYF
jgi:hypothetical protein